MSKSVTKFSRFALLGLLVALLITNTLILAPEVGAASDTNKTETNMILTENIPSAEEYVLTQRAITMDEAKKEALAAVNEQLAILAAVEEEKAEDVIQTQTEDVEDDYDEPETYYETSAQSSSTSSIAEKETTVAKKTSAKKKAAQTSANYDFLMDIDYPDSSYAGCSIALTDYDRDMAERIVMGEAGSTGFTGMALVAQCLRDTYITGGYSSIADVIYDNGYYGSMSITPSSTCREVISYIFDQGGSAVQHRIRVFYATNYCSSPWHESQEYVCSYGYVRFFDMYY